MLKKFLSLFLHLFSEQRCNYCLSPYHKNISENNTAKVHNLYGLCQNCAQQLKKYDYTYCTNCGKIPPINNALSKQEIKLSSCEHCIKLSLAWDKLSFYALYDGILEDIIKQSKFNDNLIFTYTLADLIAPSIDEFMPFDFIVPMPLHKTRLLERGYNQCLEIAKYLNKKYHYPYQANALIKTRHTKSQSTLSQAQRKTNLQDAFWADEEIVKGKNILLFDDVSTTGSTLFWASKALKKAKAKNISVFYIAGTRPYNN